MTMKSGRYALLSHLLVVLLTGTGSAQNTRAAWYAFDMGFRGAETGNTTVLSVIGQVFVGVTRSSNMEITSGFLADSLVGGTIVGVAGQEEVTASYSLAQNYPNPFNPSTTIHFELPGAARVTLRVYNVLGQEVMTVLDEEKVAGRHDVRIDASALSSGAYFYRLQAEPPATSPGLREGSGAFVQTRKFLLLR